ncbi:calmodulin [Pseudohyphozyma bogoriensis]|nr:calmodulin [Pseudohyphozyma bogoriensis]
MHSPTPLQPHHRSDSELTLKDLHFDALRLTDTARIVRAPSYISDEDLESLPPLGKSVVEEEEDAFARAAVQALRHIHANDDGDVFSPYAQSPAPPDSDENPYFGLSHHSSSFSARRSYSSSSSSASTPGSYSSLSDSSYSSHDGPWTPPLSTTNSPPSFAAPGIASRRGLAPGKLHLPPAPALRKKSSTISPRRGLLKDNFGGLETGHTGRDIEIDAPLTPRLRTKRSNGFAF